MQLCTFCLSGLTETDWIALGTIGTFLLAFVAFTTLFIQGKQFKKLRDDENERAFKNSSVMLILDFDKQFNDLGDLRFQAGKVIIEKKILDEKVIDYKLVENQLGEIYDFFDTLGFFVNNTYIKPEIVHQYFYYWFTHYYEFYQEYNIKQLSGYDETVWINLTVLSKKMQEIEQLQLGRKKHPNAKTTLKKFFKEEASDI